MLTRKWNFIICQNMNGKLCAGHGCCSCLWQPDWPWQMPVFRICPRLLLGIRLMLRKPWQIREQRRSAISLRALDLLMAARTGNCWQRLLKDYMRLIRTGMLKFGERLERMDILADFRNILKTIIWEIGFFYGEKLIILRKCIRKAIFLPFPVKVKDSAWLSVKLWRRGFPQLV